MKGGTDLLSEFSELAEGKRISDDMNHKWCIARAPVGNVRPDDFTWAAEPVREPEAGEVLLKTLYLSLAPVMRDYMSGKSFAGETPLQVGDVIHGRGVAQVVKSRHPNWHEGQVVQGQIGWQTYKISKMIPQEKMRAMPPNGLPASLGLGALGMTGLSAWAGFYAVGEPRRGERILLSGAAGGVGSLVAQMAANVTGCDVVGIAGGPEKCAEIERLGCRASIDYKTGDIREKIADACPDGINVYFDNVGGETLDAAMDHLRPGARIVLCGSISEYTRNEPYRLPDYTRLRRTDSQMRGFFVYNHLHRWDQAMEEMAAWIRDGRLQPLEQFTEGFENMPAALAGLYTGSNMGKQICHVRGEPTDWI